MPVLDHKCDSVCFFFRKLLYVYLYIVYSLACNMMFLNAFAH